MAPRFGFGKTLLQARERDSAIITGENMAVSNNVAMVRVELLSGKKVITSSGVHHERYMIGGSSLDGTNERTHV